MNWVTKSLLIFLSLILTSCGYKKVDSNDYFVKDLSQKYREQLISKELETDYTKKFALWYRSFNNKELDQLINIALSNNLDISKGKLRLQAAAYQLGKYRQALFPSLDVNVQSTKEHFSTYASNSLQVIKDENMINIGVVASYEIDIWGKNYANYQGAKTRLKASEEEFNSIKISVVASLMNLWINLMSLREILVVLNNKLAFAMDTLNLQRFNYTSGSIDLTDLLQQENFIISIKDQIKDIKYAEVATLRSINILLGKDPLEKLKIKSNKLPILKYLPSNELNILALSNRPDIKISFYNMLASKWDAKVANLSRLPSFSLNPQFNLGSNSVNTLLDNWLLRIVFNATMPIFRAGALYDNDKATKLLSEASVVEYKQVIFNAISEFKDALDNEVKYIETISNTKEQTILLEETTNQLQGKYLNGDANYIEFLIASNAVNDLKVNLIEKQKNILLNRIILYRVLGIAINEEEIVNVKA